jgi:hypothetical protein
MQQDVIGQNLADITHPEFSAIITRNLKSSLNVSESVMDNIVVSQYRQFLVRFKPTVSYSSYPAHFVRSPPPLSLTLSHINTLSVEPLMHMFMTAVRQGTLYVWCNNIMKRGDIFGSYVMLHLLILKERAGRSPTPPMINFITLYVFSFA